MVECEVSLFEVVIAAVAIGWSLQQDDHVEPAHGLRPPS